MLFADAALIPELAIGNIFVQKFFVGGREHSFWGLKFFFREC